MLAMLFNNIFAIVLLLTPSTASSPTPHGNYCSDYASEEKTRFRFSFEDVGVPEGCSECRKAFIDAQEVNTPNKTIESLKIWYTINSTANGLKLVIQPGKYMRWARDFLEALGLSPTIWDDGLPYIDLGPYNEDLLTLPIDKAFSAPLKYSSCALGLARNSVHFCSAHASPLLNDIRLQFVQNHCSPFLGRLDFLQVSDSSQLELLGSVGWGFQGSSVPATVPLVKITGTDLSGLFNSKSLGNDSAMHTYDYWLGSNRIEYDFLLDKVFVNVKGSRLDIEFARCQA